jgi:adenosine/AMP kinase
MEQNSFNLIIERLNSIKEITVGVENFTYKQTELFEALNGKFPNIEQFSNALRDANELLMFVENIQSDANICIENVKQLHNIHIAELQKQSKINSINQTLNSISSKLNDIDELDNIEQGLELLLLKVGYQK